MDSTANQAMQTGLAAINQKVKTAIRMNKKNRTD
jgi:hypothetical protein